MFSFHGITIVAFPCPRQVPLKSKRLNAFQLRPDSVFCVSCADEQIEREMITAKRAVAEDGGLMEEGAAQRPGLVDVRLHTGPKKDNKTHQSGDV